MRTRLVSSCLVVVLAICLLLPAAAAFAAEPDGYYVARSSVASYWYLVFIAGLLLLSVEAFIPGFHVIGITGILLVIYGLVLAFQHTASMTTVLGAAVLALVTIGVLVKVALDRGVFQRLSLNSTTPGDSAPAARTLTVGQEGISITPLRPSGTAQFGTDRFSVVTEGEFIASGVRVEVTSITGARIAVRRAD